MTNEGDFLSGAKKHEFIAAFADTAAQIMNVRREFFLVTLKDFWTRTSVSAGAPVTSSKRNDRNAM